MFERFGMKARLLIVGKSLADPHPPPVDPGAEPVDE
jgi:hypothetical protein